MQKNDVVIIGSGITGLTLAFYLKKAGKNVLILEKSNKYGGAIQTIKKGDFLYEAGPNTGSMTSDEMFNLFEDLKPSCHIEIANNIANSRWIWKGNKWHNLPSGLLGGIFTPLFSIKDKFRILGEPWRKKGTNPNESIASLVKRRLGKSYLNYAVNPFVGGVYAGNPEILTTRFALPKLYNLEQNYGSFIGGSIKLGKEKKAKGITENRYHKKVFSALGGIGELTKAITNNIGQESLQLGVSKITVNYSSKEFTINYTTNNNQQKQIQSKKVITTCGGYALPDILTFASPKIMQPFVELRHAKVVLVVVGYKNWKGIPLNAFGGLNPEIENRKALGILFPSTLFENRAPKNGALLSVFMGGMRNPSLIDKSNEEIKQIVLNEIAETLKEHQTPDLFEVHRYPYAIPQYEASTEQRLESINKLQKQFNGLFLAGNVRDGVGLSDRVKQAKKLADKIIAE